jgi:hypothetical protein
MSDDALLLLLTSLLAHSSKFLRKAIWPEPEHGVHTLL